MRQLLDDLSGAPEVVAAQAAVVSLPVTAARLGIVVATARRINGYRRVLVTSVADLSACIE